MTLRINLIGIHIIPKNPFLGNVDGPEDDPDPGFEPEPELFDPELGSDPLGGPLDDPLDGSLGPLDGSLGSLDGLLGPLEDSLDELLGGTPFEVPGAMVDGWVTRGLAAWIARAVHSKAKVIAKNFILILFWVRLTLPK